MNLFNYLMTKKGHNTSVRDDLLAYLLGKRIPKEVKTATGTTISISDVTSEKIVSLTLDKESTQDGTPSPEFPQEVKTVKGNVGITISDGTNTRNYTIPLGNNEICGIGDYKDELIVDKNGHCWLNKKTSKYVFSGTEGFGTQYNTSSRSGFYTSSNLFTDIKPYTNGNEVCPVLTSKFKPTTLNATWVVGNVAQVNYAGADKRLYFFLEANKTVKDMQSVIADQIVYYALETPQRINLNYTVDIELFKGINNISNSDNMYMVLKYY